MRKIGFALSFGLLVFVLFAFALSTSEKAKPESLVNWLTWEEAVKKSKVEKRKVFVDVYTMWCGWCKRMDSATFQQPYIAKYLNDHYYPVKFDAEYKKDIEFKGKTYQFVKSGKKGYHQLAAEITRGRLSFPTIVFLDEKWDILQPIPGFKNANTFEQIITYFGEDQYKKVPWAVYQKNYKPLPKVLPASNTGN